MLPVIYIVVPCYNEESVLPVTADMFLNKIKELIEKERISNDSRILYVNDGSRDATWDIICSLSEQDEHYIGIAQSKNRGHQNAILAGMMEAKDNCDALITLDCDGQDDINAIDKMLDEYQNGCEIVYGVRKDRSSDTFFKRFTAEAFYRIMKCMGVETIFNHADYRLVSKKVLNEFANYKEVNIFLRGMFPMVGFKSTCVYYERFERMAGETHYPLKKMLELACEGITSLSIKPLRMISLLGIVIALISFVGTAWSICMYFLGRTVSGWTSMTCIMSFIGGVQLISIGVLGEYIGKIYLEVKARPRYIISERTWEKDQDRESKKVDEENSK